MQVEHTNTHTLASKTNSGLKPGINRAFFVPLKEMQAGGRYLKKEPCRLTIEQPTSSPVVELIDAIAKEISFIQNRTQRDRALISHLSEMFWSCARASWAFCY